ncbi:lysM and putative peptidoglycan-binding domain-containing protein 3 isoform X2 [Dendroctonus ponderosae]|uniref:lysM and putative peptidoglycan-binding domain-containing protein 3 isoform X2 n=1 Tax=Dendroctonus ponderosae TaxID=77166 RepID=UPI00203501A3|nr:lysM and putative peptidoglycan-binding domain-containing protein 3 isoform X2 [Dendroctonus ponderosae]
MIFRSKYYKRLQSSKRDSDDSSGEETELFVRNKSPKKEIPTKEKTIDEGDTLQSLAIRYHCTIEDLKRLNNIHKENEIFARRTIKVPHRPLSEALAGIHDSGKSSPTDLHEPSTSRLIDVDMLESKLEKEQDKSGELNQIIFNSNIAHKDVERDDSVSNEYEDGRLLPLRSPIASPDPIISRINCSGSDWDISYPALVVCIILVIFAVPLIYVFYIAEHPEKYQNHTHFNR